MLAEVLGQLQAAFHVELQGGFSGTLPDQDVVDMFSELSRIEFLLQLTFTDVLKQGTGILKVLIQLVLVSRGSRFL